MPSDEQETFDAIERALGHRFRDRVWLHEALTHRSYANERPQLAPRDNERLEFLGDALLGAVVAFVLIERFPDAAEGELTRRRAALVCESGLAEVARELGLGAALLLGKGEERSGGREKPRLLSSALEACFGAVLRDVGTEQAFSIARALFEPRLVAAASFEHDFKSRVQEIVQARGGRSPRYAIVGTDGPDHARRYEVALEVDGNEIARGIGRSKGEAEQQAARAALETLQPQGEAG
jgi:ribonuclease-3